METNLGPVMDAAVDAAARRMKPQGRDADYDLVAEHFDLICCLLQDPGLLETDVDPIQHFLGLGTRPGPNPEINFSTRSYLSRYPGRKNYPRKSPYLHWLRDGKAKGEVADPAPRPWKMARHLGLETSELVQTLAETRTDLQNRLRTGTLGEMFARAAKIEPLIGDSWVETTRPKIPPLVAPHVVDQIEAIHACHTDAGFTRARIVLVAGEPRWGGGRRAEGHMAHALARFVAPTDIAVIYTDRSGKTPAGRFPEGVREIDLAGRARKLKPASAYRALVELIRSLDADAVVNINSRMLYQAMTSYGRALAASERIFLMLFCNEQLPMGNWIGPPLRYLYRCFDVVEGVMTDSEYLADWIRRRHKMSPEQSMRVHVLRAPVDSRLPIATPPQSLPSRRPQVYWAGRFDRQKRIETAFAVARLMPDIDFRMWGESVLRRGDIIEPPENVRLEGAYEHIQDIELSAADVWLYTSAWDGAPTQLLEVAMTGIPIVGSLVGGTGEILSEEESWPVIEVDDPFAYVRAIRAVLADPEAARLRSRGLRVRLLQERPVKEYAERVAALLLGAERAGAGAG